MSLGFLLFVVDPTAALEMEKEEAKGILVHIIPGNPGFSAGENIGCDPFNDELDENHTHRPPPWKLT